MKEQLTLEENNKITINNLNKKQIQLKMNIKVLQSSKQTKMNNYDYFVTVFDAWISLFIRSFSAVFITINYFH